ncbi:hypothetical protein [Sphingomonas sp.]|uniref:hypothetical protein n=1 Tax=Sphingomonas sp. TaxID=28214 RepID=UPI0038AEF2B2
MARPLTRAQALQNRAFLRALRETGNVRLACRELGLKYGTMQHRRREHPAFALRWDAALAFAQARLARPLSPIPLPQGGEGRSYRTKAGEPQLVRLKSGKLQMRRAQPGKLTHEAEQAFLAALSATCNMTLAAAAVGSCFGAFNRRRKKDPAFAREMRIALQRGYEALELALLESQRPASHAHGDWRHNDPPAMPPMTVNQALQLMYLHQKAALLVDEPTPIRRRRGESHEACCERLAQMAEARDQRSREAFEVAEAERWARGEPAWGPAGAELRRALGLTDLALVTGWSRADPTKVPHDPGRALFGGWRMEDMEEKLERAAPRIRRF